MWSVDNDDNNNTYSDGLAAALGNELNIDTGTGLTITVAETTTTVTESSDQYCRFVNCGASCLGLLYDSIRIRKSAVSCSPMDVHPAVNCIRCGLAAATTTSTPTTTVVASTTSITTPSPVQSDIAANCDTFYQVISGDSCYVVASTYGITLANFYSWNPAVGSSCPNLDVGDYVCVEVTAIPPAPTQPGAISTCTAWHYVVSGDGCYSISEEYGITTNEFYTWNTGVGDTCANLYLNCYVCVSA